MATAGSKRQTGISIVFAAVVAVLGIVLFINRYESHKRVLKKRAVAENCHTEPGYERLPGLPSDFAGQPGDDTRWGVDACGVRYDAVVRDTTVPSGRKQRRDHRYDLVYWEIAHRP